MTDRKIYTKRGDRGETRLLSGEVVSKDDARVKTYGAVDELQSHLGAARSICPDAAMKQTLYSIQENLFTAAAELAATTDTIGRLKRRIAPADIEDLERGIDELSCVYGLPRRFVVPGNTPAGAAVHIARAVCRRCERLIVGLNRKTGEYDTLIRWFNRLGDLLFTLAWGLEVWETTARVIDELRVQGNRL